MPTGTVIPSSTVWEPEKSTDLSNTKHDANWKEDKRNRNRIFSSTRITPNIFSTLTLKYLRQLVSQTRNTHNTLTNNEVCSVPETHLNVFWFTGFRRCPFCQDFSSAIVKIPEKNRRRYLLHANPFSSRSFPLLIISMKEPKRKNTSEFEAFSFLFVVY